MMMMMRRRRRRRRRRECWREYLTQENLRECRKLHNDWDS
jgi:hypothetical protein